jgi:transcriptional regulator with XRE-family HTH domain
MTNGSQLFAPHFGSEQLVQLVVCLSISETKPNVMSLSYNITKIRERKGLLQKQLAVEANSPYTTYSKEENYTLDNVIDELERFARYFDMTIDQVVHFDNQPTEVTIQDKPTLEHVNLINQLDEEKQTVVFKIIDYMLTKRSLRIFSTTTLLLYSGLI